MYHYHIAIAIKPLTAFESVRVYAYQMLEEVINVVTDGLDLAALELLERGVLSLVHPVLLKNKCDFDYYIDNYSHNKLTLERGTSAIPLLFLSHEKSTLPL